jgi:hypothetical protein
MRRGVSSDDLPVLDEHRSDRGHAVGAPLMCPAGTSGYETQKYDDRDGNRERRQRRSPSLFHVPQRRPHSYNARNVRRVTFGSEAAPAPASGQRVRLRSLDRVSSHKQVSGNRATASNYRGLADDCHRRSSSHRSERNAHRTRAGLTVEATAASYGRGGRPPIRDDNRRHACDRPIASEQDHAVAVHDLGRLRTMPKRGHDAKRLGRGGTEQLCASIVVLATTIEVRS